jgi:hypothetical protein
MSSVKPIVVSVAGLAVLGICGWIAFQTGSEAVSSSDSATVSQSTGQPGQTAPTLAPDTPATNPVGVAPSVRPSTNANVASIAEAARSGRNPERMSMLIAPKPFDPAAYAANPQGYLNVIEPGRVFQSAQPGVGVPVLDIIGTGSLQIPVGGSCDLVVSTAPLAPVTYTTMDLGTFQNGLTTITVRADAEGMAKAVYSASGGVIADVAVLVGSPLASGQVRFHVFVTEPTVAVSKP